MTTKNLGKGGDSKAKGLAAESSVVASSEKEGALSCPLYKHMLVSAARKDPRQNYSHDDCGFAAD